MVSSIKQLCVESDSVQRRLIIEVIVLQFTANDSHCVITTKIIQTLEHLTHERGKIVRNHLHLYQLSIK